MKKLESQASAFKKVALNKAPFAKALQISGPRKLNLGTEIDYEWMRNYNNYIPDLHP
jgi:hypothetical protein